MASLGIEIELQPRGWEAKEYRRVVYLEMISGILSLMVGVEPRVQFSSVAQSCPTL